MGELARAIGGGLAPAGGGAQVDGRAQALGRDRHARGDRLCELYDLSDDQVEYQLRDRLSFVRFLGLGLEDTVPDAKTVWLYREQLAQAGVIEHVFDDFDGHLRSQGYLAMGGQIIDASIVPVPKQRNSRDENARIKAGETPEGWAEQPAKRAQKDTDARWTQEAR